MYEWREPFVGGGSMFFASNYNGSAVKTLLRYPGGKVKYAKDILSQVPTSYMHPTSYWINDKHDMLTDFYNMLQSKPNEIIELCETLPSSKEIFLSMLHEQKYRLGVRFFYMNRTAWIGRVNPDAPTRNHFTHADGWSSKLIPKIADASRKIQNVKITNVDFEDVISADGNNVLLYCDPPYVSDTLATASNKLYRHGFTLEDHTRLAQSLKRTKHKFLLSYDDNEIVKELYREWADIAELDFVYLGTNTNAKKRTKELLITNFEEK